MPQIPMLCHAARVEITRLFEPQDQRPFRPLRYASSRSNAMHLCSSRSPAHSSSACTAAGAAAGSGSAAAGDAASGGSDGWWGGSDGSDRGSGGKPLPDETNLGGDEWEEPAAEGGSSLLGDMAGAFGWGGDD